MRRLIIAALALALMALPVGASLTFSAGRWTLALELTTAHKNRLGEAITGSRGYQATVECVAGSVELGCGVPSTVGVADGACTAGQIGQDITNPESEEAFTSRMVGCLLAAEVAAYEATEAVKTVLLGTPPDITFDDP